MKEQLLLYLNEHKPARTLFEMMCKSGSVYLIGGVLREYRDHSAFVSLRDIDVVIDVKDREVFLAMIEQYSLHENRFGGHKLFCSDLLIDVWDIENTWAYREKIIDCPHSEYVSRLADTVFLNIDGIIFDWENNIWLDEKYVNAMQTKILDVVLPQNPLIMLNTLRTIILMDRYEMSLSAKLVEIIKDEYKKYESMQEFVEMLDVEQKKRYAHQIIEPYILEEKTAKIINKG